MIQHRLKLHFAKDIPEDPGGVATKTVPIRERLLRFLLGQAPPGHPPRGPRRQRPTDRHHRNRGRFHGVDMEIARIVYGLDAGN